MAIGGVMMAVSAASAVTGAVGGAMQYDALGKSGQFEQNGLEKKAQYEDWRAADALQRGDLEAAKSGVSNRNIIGNQRVGYAAQGVDVNTGSAADVQASTAGVGAMDRATIKTNAWRESLGYTQEADNLRTQKELSRMSTENQQKQTILSSGLGFLNTGAKGLSYLK